MPRPTPSLFQIAALGAGLSLAAALVSLQSDRWRHGRSDRDAVARLEAELRTEFAGQVASLTSLSGRVTTDDLPALLLAGNPGTLFARLEAATAETGGDLAATIYTPSGTALAWAGRPSEVPVPRTLTGRELFVAPGPQGWRLVLLQAVPVDGAPGLRRLGALVAERLLTAPESVDRPSVPSFEYATSHGPVTLWPTRFVTGNEETPAERFLIPGLDDVPLLEARVDVRQLRERRDRFGKKAVAIGLWGLALTLLTLAWHLGATRRGIVDTRTYLLITLEMAALVGLARALAWWSPLDAWTGVPIFARGLFAVDSGSPVLLRTPFDFAVSALTALALVGVLADPVVRARAAWRARRLQTFESLPAALTFLVLQLAAGLGAALLLASAHPLAEASVASPSFPIQRLSPWPPDAGRLAVLLGLLAWQAAAVWGAILVLRLAWVPFRLASGGWSPAAASVVWLAGAAIGAGALRPALPQMPFWIGMLAVIGGAVVAARVERRVRHRSEARRLLAGFAALWVPALLLYPVLRHHTELAKRRTVETEYTAQVMTHAALLRERLRQATAQIDRQLTGAEELRLPPGAAPAPSQAFDVWRRTVLADDRLTSAVELYSPDGALVSRFALDFPEYGVAAQNWTVQSCEWETYGETIPFGSGERRMLHAERALCAPVTTGPTGPRRPTGGVVVHLMLDYPALPFISVRDPYAELLRAPDGRPPRGPADPDMVLVIYGWGRSPVFTSADRAWPLTDELFERIHRDGDRRPFWVTLPLGDTVYDIHFSNDRQGIYAIGYPTRAFLDDWIDVAELSTLVVVFFVAWRIVRFPAAWLLGTAVLPGRHLLDGIRRSFYRKVFLALAAAAVVPVLVLAFLVRAYLATRLQSDIEAEAVRTSAVAQRVIEESLSALEAGPPLTLTDDIMVWISRIIEQDVNIFDGPQLLATSERDLFASGLLPTRVPAAVYRAITIDRLPNFVGEDRIADFRYLTAAAPVRRGNRDLILTVPLALRQREIERKVDELDRSVNLGVIVFISLGAAIGFWMAERIGDPVRRLTRATKRIASGDLDARALVKSADELERLVEDFNRMAEELKRQRDRLERTNRLEAWAEMARQVAHDIKNPLTPIQLSAEHLRRVHEDRGRPLDPVLDSCVDAILAQVRLLRRLSAEFSSFATSPTPRLVPESLGDVVSEVTRPYRTALEGRVRFDIDVPATLPRLLLDRTLIGRALTNILENALHAMPDGGVCSFVARLDDGRVSLSLSDTGVGMDPESLARIFEPYFSTKATGTGLGLSIAKRNVELHGGTLTVESRLDHGTTVTLALPVNGQEPEGR
jgi:signal transduction histidine kinase